ncbi:MAG: hypothetical protein JRL30_15635 [Deltaproteobacteria bacterium]|nr:hypothetical protein [Deltaproteobacteria bacterium]
MKHILAGKTAKPLRNMMARILLEHLTSRRLACACVFLALVLSTVPAGALDEGRSGPIQMPFFEQGQAGTCWANCGKMLQKGLYPGYLGATFTYEVFQFMRLMKISLNGGIYSDSDYSKFANLIGRGKTIKWAEYYKFSSAQKKIIEELNRGNPVIFARLDHVVLVVGYEKDVAGDLYLIQHNPQGVMYEKQKWEDIATLWNWQDVIALIWAADIPDPNRALQSINLPGQNVNDRLKFIGSRTDNDPGIRLHLKFDETSIDGYPSLPIMIGHSPHDKLM